MSLLADSVDFYLFMYLFIAYSATEVRQKHFKERQITLQWFLHYITVSETTTTKNKQTQPSYKIHVMLKSVFYFVNSKLISNSKSCKATLMESQNENVTLKISTVDLL